MEFGFSEVDATLNGKEMLFVGIVCTVIALFIIFI